jgi:hypothetical protein
VQEAQQNSRAGTKITQGSDIPETPCLKQQNAGQKAKKPAKDRNPCCYCQGNEVPVYQKASKPEKAGSRNQSRTPPYTINSNFTPIA